MQELRSVQAALAEEQTKVQRAQADAEEVRLAASCWWQMSVGVLFAASSH